MKIGKDDTTSLFLYYLSDYKIKKNIRVQIELFN